MIDIPIQQYLNEAVREEREEKEITSWHISRLGSCLRGLYLERIGEKPDTEFDDRTLRVFSVGKMFEDWFVSLLVAKPIKTETQVRIESRELGVSGYADFVAEYKGEKKVYEIKTKHSKSFWYMEKEGKPMRQHQYQLWMYLHLLDIDEGAILYISKDDLALAEYPVYKNDESIKQEVFNELDLLNKAWKDKNPSILPLPEEPWKGKYCRFHSKCLKL